MTRKCPHLPEITVSFLHLVKSTPNILKEADMTAYLENLVTFFFSPQSVKLEEDVMWFLHHVNTIHSVSTQSSQDGMEVLLDEDTIDMDGDSSIASKDQSPLLNVLSTAMAKQVLGVILTHPQGDEMVVGPLYIFHGKVMSMCQSTLYI